MKAEFTVITEGTIAGVYHHEKLGDRAAMVAFVRK
jgi:hypothetical protein